MALLTLNDVKPDLHIPLTTTTWDTQIQGFIDAATPVVEDLAGIILPRTITNEAYDGGVDTIILRSSPVISIQSVVEFVGVSQFTLTAQPLGSTVDNYGYELIEPLGGVLLRRGSSGDAMPFLGGRRGVRISYTAGYSVTPANVKQGAITLIQFWYQRTQQGGRPQFNSQDASEGVTSMFGFAVPNFVVEMLASTPSSPRRIPGIA